MFRPPGYLFWLLIFVATKTHQGLDDVHMVFFWLMGTFAICDTVDHAWNTVLYDRVANDTSCQVRYHDTKVPPRTNTVSVVRVDESRNPPVVLCSDENYLWIRRGSDEAQHFEHTTSGSFLNHVLTYCVVHTTNYKFTTWKGRDNAETANWCLVAVYLITWIVTGIKPDGFLQDDNTDLLLMLSWAVMLWMQHIFQGVCETTVIFNCLSLMWVLFNRIVVSTNNSFVYVFPIVMVLMEVPCFRRMCILFFALDWSYVIFNVTFCCFTVTLFLAKFMIQASRVVKSSVHDHRYVLIAAGVLIFMAFITVERKVQVYWSLLAKLFRSKIFGWKVWIPGGLISTAMQTALHCMSDQDCFQQVMDYCEVM